MFSRKQKTVFGLGLFMFLLSLFGPVVATVSAITQAQINGANYKATSRGTIQMTVLGPPNDGNTVYTFTDTNPGDTNYQYEYALQNPVANEMCYAAIKLSGSIPTNLQAQTSILANITGFIANSGDDNLFDCLDDTLRATFGPRSIQVVIPVTVSQGGNTTSEADDPTCESTYSSGSEWLLCGFISQIDKIVTKMTDIVEGQLNFDVEENLNLQVKRVWSTMRILATSVIIIIALIMIISQAINWGPFDAYTVRKMLPRIVAAVILMQLSWALGIWIIEFFNAAGKGIADIMYFPFGGASKLSLENQLANLGWGAGTTFIGALLVGTVGGLFFLGPFGILLLAFTVLMAILTALFVLLFRKIIIIFCMILAPIALVMWILPGTQKYWNLWWDTFIKVLMMFPLIIALIAAGRIFASVAATGSGNAGILDLLAVLIGFFGVFFILPKTFQYGGKLFASVGGSVSNGSKKLGGSPAKLLSERKAQRKEFKRDAANARLTDPNKNHYTGFRGVARKFSDRAVAGRMDPTLYGPGMENERRKHELEGAQKGVAHRQRKESFEAQMAGIEATEQKRLREFAAQQLQGLNTRDTLKDEYGNDRIGEDDKPLPGEGAQVLIRMLNSENEAERVAAIDHSLQTRDYGKITEAVQTDPAYSKAFAANPSLFGTVNATRADLLPHNVPHRNPADVMTGSDSENAEGLSIAQLATQHQSFFVGAANSFENELPGLKRTESLNEAVKRIDLIAKNSNINGGIAGNTSSEKSVNRILEMHAQATGTEPLTFTQLMNENVQVINSPGNPQTMEHSPTIQQAQTLRSRPSPGRPGQFTPPSPPPPPPNDSDNEINIDHDNT